MGKVTLRHGEHEIEVEGSEGFIKQQLSDFYGKIDLTLAPTAALRASRVGKAGPTTSGKKPAPAEFYKEKGKTDGVSKVLIFGKYLELYRDQSEFTRADINEVAKEAKLAKDIHSQYLTNAVKQGLLRQISTGKYSLTLSAEEVLASM